MDEYKFINKALLFPMEKILVLADLHIGHEEAMNKAGIFLPRVQFKQTIEDLGKIFSEVGKVSMVIILGDLKHEFGTISDQEWKETLAVLDYLKGKAKKVVLIKGNHDTILGPIARRKEVEIRDFYVHEKICFIHGDKQYSEVLDKQIEMVVMGHRHPAITLREGSKAETYKCFLVGKWKGKRVIILPSFFPMIEGTDILGESRQNYLFIPQKDLKNFKAFIVGDKIYDFGKVGKIGRLN